MQVTTSRSKREDRLACRSFAIAACGWSRVTSRPIASFRVVSCQADAVQPNFLPFSTQRAYVRAHSRIQSLDQGTSIVTLACLGRVPSSAATAEVVRVTRSRSSDPDPQPGTRGSICSQSTLNLNPSPSLILTTPTTAPANMSVSYFCGPPCPLLSRAKSSPESANPEARSSRLRRRSPRLSSRSTERRREPLRQAVDQVRRGQGRRAQESPLQDPGPSASPAPRPGAISLTLALLSSPSRSHLSVCAPNRPPC